MRKNTIYEGNRVTLCQYIERTDGESERMHQKVKESQPRKKQESPSQGRTSSGIGI